MSDVTGQYLAALYGEPDGLIGVSTFAPAKVSRAHETGAAAAAEAARLDATGAAGVYHRGTTLNGRPAGGRGRAEDSAAVYFYAVDGDVAGPGHAAANLPPDRAAVEQAVVGSGLPLPTTWVASGGGFYPQWWLAEPVDVRHPDDLARARQAFDRLQAHVAAVWADHGWKLDPTADLARVWRLPGTTNRKVATRPVVATWDGDSGRRHHLDDLLACATRAPQQAAGTALQVAAGAPVRLLTGPESERAVAAALALVDRRARDKGRFNVTLNDAALAVGHHVPAFLPYERAVELLAQRCAEAWDNPADAADLATIASGLAAGMREPYAALSAATPLPADLLPPVPAGSAKAVVPQQIPGGLFGDPERLEITYAGDAANWLHDQIGRGRLAGFFRRDDKLVFTPAEGEEGYVAPRPGKRGRGNSDGPAQVRPASAHRLAAIIRTRYAVFKTERQPNGDAVEHGELFPVPAARAIVEAPEMCPNLRELTGVVHTPVIRDDGTLLDRPGYDDATGLLYLPAPGLVVPLVAAEPTPADLAAAVALLDEMLDGFVWRGKHDKANFYGLLLTPVLRELFPPPYKGFIVTAHQPGSGKTLLAALARIIHGGVFRSEMPGGEDELKKVIFAILMTTTAPCVVIDNVTGNLKSSTLAGLLTTATYSDRVLGATSNMTATNDRVWLFTGNNVSLGGDIPRRTVTIGIDPGVPDPQNRTGFKIGNLETWTTARRGELIAALLTIVRAWVAAGRPLLPAAQSDGYAEWETGLRSILHFAGVPGLFDDEESRTGNEGSEDEEWGAFLAVLERQFGGGTFLAADVAKLIATFNGPITNDEIPEQMLRDGATSRRVGKWLANREGRWVDGLTVRQAGTLHRAIRWRVVRHGSPFPPEAATG